MLSVLCIKAKSIWIQYLVKNFAVKTIVCLLDYQIYTFIVHYYYVHMYSLLMMCLLTVIDVSVKSAFRKEVIVCNVLIYNFIYTLTYIVK